MEITIKVQKLTRHFTSFDSSDLEIYAFSHSIAETPSAYFILLWWIIRRDMEVSSEFPFLLVCVNQSLMLLLCCFCGSLSSTSTVFVWSAFSKIKHLPHWQRFWLLHLPKSSYTDDIKPTFFFPNWKPDDALAPHHCQDLNWDTGNYCNTVLNMKMTFLFGEGSRRVMKWSFVY